VRVIGEGRFTAFLLRRKVCAFWLQVRGVVEVRGAKERNFRLFNAFAWWLRESDA